MFSIRKIVKIGVTIGLFWGMGSGISAILLILLAVVAIIIRKEGGFCFLLDLTTTWRRCPRVLCGKW